MIAVVRMCTILIWAIALTVLLIPFNGRVVLQTFLNPQLWWLVASGAIILTAFLVVTFTGLIHGDDSWRMGRDTLRDLMLIVPVPFIFLHATAQYGQDALANRLTTQNTQFKGTQDSAALLDTSTVPLDDSVYTADMLELIYAPPHLTGKQVKATGMIYRGNENPDGYDFCFRYAMVCCAADAVPVGVYFKQQDSLTIIPDAWYEIEGTLVADTLDRFFVVILENATIRKSQTPDQTWLYPNQGRYW